MSLAGRHLADMRAYLENVRSPGQSGSRRGPAKPMTQFEHERVGSRVPRHRRRRRGTGECTRTAMGQRTKRSADHERARVRVQFRHLTG
jgi:hypothetical protein